MPDPESPLLSGDQELDLAAVDRAIREYGESESLTEAEFEAYWSLETAYEQLLFQQADAAVG